MHSAATVQCNATFATVDVAVAVAVAAKTKKLSQSVLSGAHIVAA